MPPEGLSAGSAGTASDRAEPVQSLLDGLDASLDEAGREALDDLRRRVFEPLRRTGDRLSTLRDEALDAESPLRAAGRAVRVACNDLEEAALPAALSGALEAHLERVASLAHSTPRTLEVAMGGAVSSPRRRRRSVPARSVVRTVLRASYPARLLERLRLGPVFRQMLQTLPEAPADVLGEVDHAARLLDEIDHGERHVRLVLDRVRQRSVDEVRELLLARSGLQQLRRRWTLHRSGARREAALEELAAQVSSLGDDVREVLRERRFAADLARRERALHEAGDAVLTLLQRAEAEAASLERLADTLESGGERVSEELVDRLGRGEEERSVGRIAKLEERVRELLGERQAALPPVDSDDSELSRELDRFVDCATALAKVAADYLVIRGDGNRRDREQPLSVARLAAPATDARRRAVEALVDARDGLQEAGEIVHHGLEAARGELVAGAAARGAEVGGLLREAFRNAANRLRETAAHVEGSLTSAGADVRDTPGEILASVRRRARPAPGAADGGPGAWSGWPDRLRGRLSRWWVALGRWGSSARRALRTWSGASPEGSEPRETASEATSGGRPAAEEDLPRLYRWLFRPDPLDEPKLLVGRDEELDRLVGLEEPWREGEAVSLALVGAPGSGKTTLLNCAARSLSSDVPVRRGQVDVRLSEEAEALDWLARFFGLEETAAASIDVLARALSDRREMVLLEGGHRLFRRVVGGYGALRAFGRVVAATAGRIGWVVTFPREPWRFLEATEVLTRRFASVLRLDAPGPEGLREIVLRRHRATGCELTWLGAEELEAEGRRRVARGGPSRSRELLEARYFEDLAETVGPCVSAALRLWRRSLVPHGEDEVRVRPLAPAAPGLPARMDRDLLQALGTFVVHGDLAAEDLADLLVGLDVGPDEALELLGREDLLQEVPGLRPAPLRLDDLLYGRVVRRLRDERILNP